MNPYYIKSVNYTEYNQDMSYSENVIAKEG